MKRFVWIYVNIFNELSQRFFQESFLSKGAYTLDDWSRR